MAKKTYPVTGKLLNDLVQHAQWQIEQRRTCNLMFDFMDAAFHNEWDWPNDYKPEWVHKVISSDPHDALRSATQILGSVTPHVKVQPLSSDAETKKRTDDLERALQWQLDLASARNQGSVIESVVQSALQYSMVCAQVLYIPYQEKMARSKGDTALANRMKAARQFGDFSIVLRHPKDVYVTESDFLPVEDVVYRRVYTRQEFIKTWGRDLYNKVNKGGDAVEGYILVYDYVDFENRFLWACEVQSLEQVDMAFSGEVILDRKHGLGFVPWVIRSSGANYYSRPEKRLKPLLYPVYKAGHWDIQNVILSLLESEVIAYSAAPRGVIKSYNPWEVQVDYGDPGRNVRITPDEDYQRIPPPGIDQGLGDALEILSGMIGKETVARMIQNPEMKADVPFSAMNLIFQLGANTLTPYKNLAEKALADICRQMLLWVTEYNVPLVSYSKEKDEKGRQIIIDPKDFDVDNLFITVVLTADVPTDKTARVNAAVMMNQRLNYPSSRGLEQVGVSDPAQAIKEYQAELMDQAALEVEISEMRARSEMRMQQMIQDMMAARQAIADSSGGGGGEIPPDGEILPDGGMPMGAVPPGGEQPADMQPGAMNPPIFDELSGMGFNAAEGGQPTIQGAPTMTRELLSGATKSGDELS